jgi:hypothetical protein
MLVPFGLTVSLTTEDMAERQNHHCNELKMTWFFLLSSGKWWSSELNCDFLLAGWLAVKNWGRHMHHAMATPGSTQLHWDSLLNANGPRQKWGMKNLASATKSVKLFPFTGKIVQCWSHHVTPLPTSSLAPFKWQIKYSIETESQGKGWLKFYKTSLGTWQAKSLGIKRFSQPQPYSRKMLHTESKRIHCARAPAAPHLERKCTKSNGSLKLPA